MIKINKSATPPSILATKGAKKTAKLKAAYKKYTGSGLSGKGKHIAMHFDKKIYGDSTVKEQLKKDQHGKCCYCEASFTGNSDGVVEHFRPKAAYVKKDERKYTYPGYYWLAYEWSNLMFSCAVCNTNYKKNHFPLNSESSRKPNHIHSNPLEEEDRLLIHPTEEDPAGFITFREEVPVAIDGNLKGQTSIEVFGLERLNDSRLEHLNCLKVILPLANIDETNPLEVEDTAKALHIPPGDAVKTIREAKELYHFAAKDSAEFACCARCKFPGLPVG
ncbi:MAG: hypothetical protein LBT76_07330 [Tannerella sp.]|jgi:uncharacterized protein (TIGR02646 family)|nr:hypothetical protein [Tannerella sp.]